MKKIFNIDCGFMCEENHNCCHPNRQKGWRRHWPMHCVEESIEAVSCDYKRNLFEMLSFIEEEVDSDNPPKPPKPPPIRYLNW